MTVYENDKPKDENSLTKQSGALSNEDMAKKENSPEQSQADSASSEERGGLFKKSDDDYDPDDRRVFNPSDKFLPVSARLAMYVSGKFTKKNGIISAIIASVIAIVFFVFTIVQGPLQFIHFGKLLEKFHMSQNESFNEGRTAKLLYYGLKGGGVQNSRLSIKGNYAADKWEKRLVKETGMKPVYSKATGRMIGFELVDEDKALTTLLDSSETEKINTKKLERTAGNGAEIIKAGDTPDNVRPTDAEGNLLGKNTRFLDLSNVPFSDRRAVIRTLGKSTNSWRAANAIGDRLLIKRGGLNYHPFSGKKDKLDKKLDGRQTQKEIEEAEKAEKEEREKTISQGVDPLKDAVPGETEDSNGDGTADSSSPADVQASDESKKLLGDFKKGVFVKGAGSAAAVVGVMCMAKAYGDGIQEFRYTNNILPMMRMGGRVVSSGSQVMSGDDLSMASLSKESKYLYDSESKTSWSGAESIKAEQGQAGGTPMPAEADLGSLSKKPKLFRLLDSVPVLGTTCGAFDAVAGLPIIKNVSSIISSVTTAGIDAALSVGGTSSDQLLLSSMKAVSGKSVDPQAKGADFGNLANTGAFLMANDKASASGGVPLSTQQAYEIKKDQELDERQQHSTESLASRYLDIYSNDSLAGSTITSIPSFGSMFNKIATNPASAISSTLANFGNNKALAASTYDYGVPRYGFSMNEQQDRRFEDPYENAKVVEPQLEALNDKYSECFNMSVTVDESGTHLESDKATDPFKFSANTNCKDSSEMFLRYRFYLADTVNVTSLACYEGDEASCAEIGAGQGETKSAESTVGLVSGEDKELAQQLLDSSKFSAAPQYLSQIQAYAKGTTSCHINPTILQLLATAIDRGYSINVSSLNRKCTGVLTASGAASYHYADGGGHAVDIAIINGTPTTGRDTNAVKLIKDLAGGLPSGSGIGQSGCGRNLNLPKGVTEFSDACNHLHIQVPKK